MKKENGFFTPKGNLTKRALLLKEEAKEAFEQGTLPDTSAALNYKLAVQWEVLSETRGFEDWVRQYDISAEDLGYELNIDGFRSQVERTHRLFTIDDIEAAIERYELGLAIWREKLEELKAVLDKKQRANSIELAPNAVHKATTP